MLETPLSNSSEDNNNSNYLSVIGVACGAGLFALLMIICGVSCIAVKMHHKKKENNKMRDPIYADKPQCPITPSNSNTVVLINPAHEMNTGKAGATNVTNLDTQDHQVLHSSNYNGRVSTTTTIATDNVNEGNIEVNTTGNVDHSYEAKTTSSSHVSHNTDKNSETDNYALTMPPPSDEPNTVDENHTTTCSSQFADSDEPTEKYATIVCPSSDVFPIADENLTTKVSCSTQAFDGVKPTGGDEYGTTSQQQNLTCYASVNQVRDAAQLSHADNNAGSNAEGM